MISSLLDELRVARTGRKAGSIHARNPLPGPPPRACNRESRGFILAILAIPAGGTAGEESCFANLFAIPTDDRNWSGRATRALVFLIVKLITAKRSSPGRTPLGPRSRAAPPPTRSIRLALPDLGRASLGLQPVSNSSTETSRARGKEREGERRALARRRDLRTLGRSMARI
jgi:hypothetical protein